MVHYYDTKVLIALRMSEVRRVIKGNENSKKR